MEFNSGRPSLFKELSKLLKLEEPRLQSIDPD